MRVNISIPDELHEKITQYCVKKGFKLSSLIAAKLFEELGQGSVGKIIDPGFNDLEEATIEVPIKTMSPKEQAKALHEEREVEEKFNPLQPIIHRTEKVVKKISKSEFCPHMISIGGVCKGCPGGIAV